MARNPQTDTYAAVSSGTWTRSSKLLAGPVSRTEAERAAAAAVSSGRCKQASTYRIRYRMGVGGRPVFTLGRKVSMFKAGGK